jgi:NSS family neurotransmitter:Na+ symporter|tara:strand:+ start:1582 stop:2952 length:1371 start_codon:yes stop_codon:yes gene_type:complete
VIAGAPTADRGAWVTRWGFVLAAAGSAVGLGNIWRFPYIVGENGGGAFVLVYLLCIVFIGLPILVAELGIGRSLQRTPVGAFQQLAGRRSAWVGLGWLGVTVAFLLLSFYSVVAGWMLRYAYFAASGALGRGGVEQVQQTFGMVYGDAAGSVVGALVFIGMNVAMVGAGIQRGVERWSRILMPALFVLLVGLVGYAATLEGFGEAVGFLFRFDLGQLDRGGLLEALGHAFFTLSVGLGGMLTYGSYLPGKRGVVENAIAIVLLDTAVALLSCLLIFPLAFTFGLPPTESPGLIFVSLPMAFAQMPAGGLVGAVFFILLICAALTSGLSMLELASSYFIDERGWSRRQAVTRVGGVIAVLALPCALTGSTVVFGSGFEAFAGKSYFDLLVDLVTNWLTPLGGLGFALFVGWRLGPGVRRGQFDEGVPEAVYRGWLAVLRFLAPPAIVLIFLRGIGLV